MDDDERGFLEELKYTDGDRFPLDARKWIVKYRPNAHQNGREPKLVVDFPGHRLRLIVTEEEYPASGA